MAKKKKLPSKSSPKDSKRGCVCPDGTYSVECCDGTLEAQGIGSLQGQNDSNKTITRETRTRTVNR